MLESYFKYPAGLAATESALKCPRDCNAPGCWMADVIVEASLFDLIRLSLALNVSVSTLFFSHCYLGLQICEINPRYYQLLIKLKKPCHFLEKSRCTVHGSKPLNCVLFPEYHQIIGHWSKLTANKIFCRFPCIKSRFVVSEKRAKALKELGKMRSREEALSYYFLIGLPSFIVDSKPIARQLKQAGLNKSALTLSDFDRLFNKQLQATGVLDNIISNIYCLDTRKGMEDFVAKVSDNTLMEPLLAQKDCPKIVHCIKGDRFKRLKRRLQIPEAVFM